jgi:hypothetical protein
MSGTWLEETLARAIHEGRMTLPVYGCIHIDREDGSYALCGADAALFLATPAGQSLAARVAALDVLIEHHEALAGPRAHHLGCECGGTNDGVHSCASFERAWLAVRGGAS